MQALVLHSISAVALMSAAVSVQDWYRRRAAHEAREARKKDHTIDFTHAAGVYRKLLTFGYGHGRGKWLLFEDVQPGPTIALAVGSVHGHYWEPEGILVRERGQVSEREVEPFASLHEYFENHPNLEEGASVFRHLDRPKLKTHAVHIHLGEERLSDKNIQRLQEHWATRETPAALLGVLYADPLEQNLSVMLGRHLETVLGKGPYDMTQNNVSVSLSSEVDVETAFSAGCSFRMHGRARNVHFLVVREDEPVYRLFQMDPLW
jgi:hypothetical protein